MNEANDDRCFITALGNTAVVESLSGALFLFARKEGAAALTDAISSGPMFAIESEYAQKEQFSGQMHR